MKPRPDGIYNYRFPLMRHDPDHPKGALLLEQTVQGGSNFLKLLGDL